MAVETYKWRSQLGAGPVEYIFGVDSKGDARMFDFWPFQISDIALSIDQAAEPKLSASNLDGHITALCLQFKDMVNVKVSIIDTYAVYLDADNFPGGVNPTAEGSLGAYWGHGMFWGHVWGHKKVPLCPLVSDK